MVLYFACDNLTARPKLQLVPNFQQNTVAILVPLVVPEAQFFNTFRSQVFFPLFVPETLLGGPMVESVQFNR